jgi:hypothetical protein
MLFGMLFPRHLDPRGILGLHRIGHSLDESACINGIVALCLRLIVVVLGAVERATNVVILRTDVSGSDKATDLGAACGALQVCMYKYIFSITV